MDLRHLQSQHNSIEKDDDNVKILLAHLKKMQNIAKVGILVSDGMVPSTKGVVDRKKVDVSIRKVIYIIS